MEMIVGQDRSAWKRIGLLAASCLALLAPAGCACHKSHCRQCLGNDCPPAYDHRNYEYPRFHPVPTRPVFSPGAPVEVVRTGLDVKETPRPAAPQELPRPSSPSREPPLPDEPPLPNQPPTPRQPPPPPSPFEEIPPSSGAQPADQTKGPSGIRLASPPSSGASTAKSGSGDWVFSPTLPGSALRRMDRSVEVKSDPAGSGQASRSQQ
jgi:hypothetical protein